MNARWPLHGLYAITPDECDTRRLCECVDLVVGAGVAVLQYRNKAANAELRERQVRALQPICREHGVPLIVNDDWRLAATTGADGVHLGAEDGDVAVARARLGASALLGASCYDDLALAANAVAAGADYVAFGAFFPSPTKPHAPRASVQLLSNATGLGVPRVAIGGIRPDNARPLIASGASMIAVISGLFDAVDPAASVRAYLSCFEPSGNPDHE